MLIFEDLTSPRLSVEDLLQMLPGETEAGIYGEILMDRLESSAGNFFPSRGSYSMNFSIVDVLEYFSVRYLWFGIKANIFDIFIDIIISEVENENIENLEELSAQSFASVFQRKDEILRYLGSGDMEWDGIFSEVVIFMHLVLVNVSYHIKSDPLRVRTHSQ